MIEVNFREIKDEEERRRLFEEFPCGVPCCGQTSVPRINGSWFCTRQEGHEGMHVACGAGLAYATWENGKENGEDESNSEFSGV